MELIELISYDFLDIEFIVDNKNRIHLIQVRPLLVTSSFPILKKNY